MHCWYCNRRLGLIKTLQRKPFCSERHVDLYRREQAAMGIERLLALLPEDRAPDGDPPGLPPFGPKRLRK